MLDTLVVPRRVRDWAGDRPARLGDEEPPKVLYVTLGAPEGKVAGEVEAGGGRLPHLGLQGGKLRQEGAEWGTFSQA